MGELTTAFSIILQYYDIDFSIDYYENTSGLTVPYRMMGRAEIIDCLGDQCNAPPEVAQLIDIPKAVRLAQQHPLRSEDNTNRPWKLGIIRSFDAFDEPDGSGVAAKFVRDREEVVIYLPVLTLLKSKGQGDRTQALAGHEVGHMQANPFFERFEKEHTYTMPVITSAQGESFSPMDVCEAHPSLLQILNAKDMTAELIAVAMTDPGLNGAYTLTANIANDVLWKLLKERSLPAALAAQLAPYIKGEATLWECFQQDITSGKKSFGMVIHAIAETLDDNQQIEPAIIQKINELREMLRSAKISSTLERPSWAQ